ncbi:MAG: hypothetical protein AABX59_03220 [Nanoarchaeota archaeon]
MRGVKYAARINGSGVYFNNENLIEGARSFGLISYINKDGKLKTDNEMQREMQERFGRGEFYILPTRQPNSFVVIGVVPETKREIEIPSSPLIRRLAEEPAPVVGGSALVPAGV